MKNILKKIGVLIGVLSLTFVGYVAYMLINPVSPKEIVRYSSENSDFEVVYSRPYKNNRLIFGLEEEGALVPYGKYWRTGANAATTFQTSSDILFNGESLKAGKYALFTLPNEDSWTVVLSSESDVFFAIYRPDPKSDVLKTSVYAGNLESPAEQFTIAFSKVAEVVDMVLMWDKTAVSIPLE
tara:strand:- start:1062 stop:1610 length:549 start_codon:yes stop_codon:yes gene_type:complete